MEEYKAELRRRYGRQWEQLKREWSTKYNRWARQLNYDMDRAWRVSLLLQRKLVGYFRQNGPNCFNSTKLYAMVAK